MKGYLVARNDKIEIPEEHLELLRKATPEELEWVAGRICPYWAAGDHQSAYDELEDEIFDESDTKHTEEEIENLLQKYQYVIEFFSQCAEEAFYTLFVSILTKEVNNEQS